MTNSEKYQLINRESIKKTVLQFELTNGDIISGTAFVSSFSQAEGDAKVTIKSGDETIKKKLKEISHVSLRQS
jgi:hypothetical protein